MVALQQSVQPPLPQLCFVLNAFKLQRIEGKRHQNAKV